MSAHAEKNGAQMGAGRREGFGEQKEKRILRWMGLTGNDWEAPETQKRERVRRIGRYGAALAVVVLLIYYCAHPELYGEEEAELSLLESGRTYQVMAFSVLLIALSLMENRMDRRLNRMLSWCWFGLGPFAVYFSLLYLNADKFNIHFFDLNKIALVFTFVFLYLVETGALILTGSLRFSVVITAVPVAVLGIVNCFVISFRGMAVSAADLFSVGTAMTVASEYTYKIDWYIYMEILLTFSICLVSLKLKGGRLVHPALRAAVLVIWGIVAGSYYHICCRTDFLEKHDIRSQGFTHQLRYKEYDMIFTTLCTCFYLAVDKPEGYSLDRVKEIASEYVEGEAGGNTAGKDSGVPAIEGKDSGNPAAGDASGSQVTIEDASGSLTAAVGGDGVQPNIIVIMNESFADYTDIGQGLDLSEDCMPFIHGLTENTIKGNFYASIFGGNTPNSEYEFLTGNTMAFLPASSVGFNLFVRGNLPSVASELKSQGYSTLAIHPYRGTNYRRHIVYPQIGFDTYYTRDDFTKPHKIRSYISDQELVDRIIQEYEAHCLGGDSEGDDKISGNRDIVHSPLFSYNVTIQNHGGYYASNLTNLDMAIEVENQGVDKEKAKIYVNLIRQSDAAFENLVNYFEDQEEPVIILMFGDHQANLGDNTYQYLIGKEENCTQEDLMEKYKVPFVIWANYDIQEEIIEKTSLNYLYSIMADRLGLPMTGYQKYLLDLREEIPVLCAQGYWGADGNFYDLKDETSPYYEKINEYQILQYNDIFGRDNRYLEFFADAG